MGIWRLLKVRYILLVCVCVHVVHACVCVCVHVVHACVCVHEGEYV